MNAMQPDYLDQFLTEENKRRSFINSRKNIECPGIQFRKENDGNSFSYKFVDADNQTRTVTNRSLDSAIASMAVDYMKGHKIEGFSQPKYLMEEEQNRLVFYKALLEEFDISTYSDLREKITAKKIRDYKATKIFKFSDYCHPDSSYFAIVQKKDNEIELEGKQLKFKLTGHALFNQPDTSYLADVIQNLVNLFEKYEIYKWSNKFNKEEWSTERRRSRSRKSTKPKVEILESSATNNRAKRILCNVDQCACGNKIHFASAGEHHFYKNIQKICFINDDNYDIIHNVTAANLVGIYGEGYYQKVNLNECYYEESGKRMEFDIIMINKQTNKVLVIHHDGENYHEKEHQQVKDEKQNEKLHQLGYKSIRITATRAKELCKDPELLMQFFKEQVESY